MRKFGLFLITYVLPASILLAVGTFVALIGGNGNADAR